MAQGLDRPRDFVVKFGAPNPQQFKSKPFKPKAFEIQQNTAKSLIVEKKSLIINDLRGPLAKSLIFKAF